MIVLKQVLDLEHRERLVRELIIIDININNNQ